MRVFGRRLSHKIVAAGTDSVLVSYPVPNGGSLNNIHLECHILGPEAVEFQQVCMYGLSIFALPQVDPDNAAVIDTMWDTMVPKDADTGPDLDRGGAATAPEFEMGEPDWSGVFEVGGTDVVEIFRRRKMLSTLNSMVNYEVASAAADLWVPGDLVKAHIGRKVRANTQTIIAVGLSSPSLDETNQTGETAPTEQEWMLLQFLDLTLEQAFISLIGLVETGAETPYVESADFIRELLEADVFEATAGAFAPVTWNVFTRATFDISTPDLQLNRTLSSE